MMQCDRCGSGQFTKAGKDRQARQLFRCGACGRRMTERSWSAFSGYRFPDDIIALAVRWYLRFRLPYADLAELLAERGIHVDPSTIRRLIPLGARGGWFMSLPRILLRWRVPLVSGTYGSVGSS